MGEDLKIRRFRPVQLTLEGVGPFRHRFELPLTDKEPDKGGEPCNFYLIGSRNGFGKTTILQTITGLMWLLGGTARNQNKYHDKNIMIPEEIIDGKGAAQLDIIVNMEKSGISQTILLSLCGGTDEPLMLGTPSRLGSHGAEIWLPLVPGPHSFSFPNGGGIVALQNFQGYRPEDRALASELLTVISDAQKKGELPAKLHDHHVPLPTALFFPAERRVYRPPPDAAAIHRPSRLSYDTAHRFVDDGETWADSLEGLFAWFLWEGEKRYNEARDLINDLMFFEERKRLGAMDRTALTPMVEFFENGEWIPRHSLDRLSHGERAMMQLLLRCAAHVSGSAIVLIDEMEAHLHYRWKRQLMQVLKKWVNKSPDLTVIVTTHDSDLISVFDVERKEGERMIKGGYLIDEDELRGEA